MQATGRQKASEKVDPDGKTNGGPGAGDRAAACRRSDEARANYRRAGRGRPSGKTNEGPGTNNPRNNPADNPFDRPSSPQSQSGYGPNVEALPAAIRRQQTR